MANSLTAFDPTIWSKQGIAILREKIAMPKLVRVDFQNDLAQMGDVVNTRKPATMTVNDVDTDGDSGLTVQNVSATNVAVTLNSHKHATWRIKDREASRSISNLMTEYMDPAMLAIANTLDKSLLSLHTSSSYLIAVASATGWRDGLNSARTQLNKNRAPESNRVLVVSDDDEGAIGNQDLVVKINEGGDPRVLREGSLGRLKGFDIYRSSNILGVNTGSPLVRHNLAFHKDAIALVTRVLSTASGRTPGAEQMVATDPDAGLSLRVTISYQHNIFATMISADLLYGSAVLDSNLLIQCKSSF